MLNTAMLRTSEEEFRASPFSKSVDRWYSMATVRRSSRIFVPDDSRAELNYPPARQILVDNPNVQARGQQVVNYILAQSAYQYMYEIGLLETRFVIDCSLNIVNNVIPGFSEEEKLDSLSVVIDEGFHAHVALDYIVQMKAITGLEPIAVPQTNGNLDAVRRAYEALPDDLHHDFQLIAVTIAEHTLTKDLVSISKARDTAQTFMTVMTDHVADEGRHAGLFARLMKVHWSRMSGRAKTKIGAMLPAYLDDYLAGDADRSFDRDVLIAAGFDNKATDAILAETDAQYRANHMSYVDVTKRNLVQLLTRAGFMDHPPTRDVFARQGALA